MAYEGVELRKHKENALKRQSEKQTQFFRKLAKHSETVALASYQLAWNIARAKKPDSEGEFVQTCLRDVVAILTPENDSSKRSVSDLQLSRHTVEQRISDINNSIETQLHTDLEKCRYFSIALDESCDIQDKPQLAIFVRAIATDGAPATLGSANGLVGLFKADDRFPDFWTFHCIIHQENLVSKKLNLDHVTKPVLEIVNFICTHALKHRQFKNLLAELDEDLPIDLLLHCTVRWLSRGNMLSRVFELLDPVKLFLAEKHKDYPELHDPQWMSDLGFLVDMLHHLNKLNLDLQGKLKMLPDLVQSVFTFVNKLKLFQTHLQKGELTHFPSLLKANGEAAEVTKRSIARYATLVENLQQNFEDRFCNLKKQRPQIAFLINPFTAESDCLKAPLVADEAASQLEMSELSEDDRLKCVLKEGTTGT
uniref:general transcription factor II-I repeat domain-containing protein 2A-like n=1 Tax=Myxine glutinosa TaxID=7769 RepID=UPI00358F209E